MKLANFYFPENMLKKLKYAAKRDGVSQGEYMRRALERKLSDHEQEQNNQNFKKDREAV